MGEICKLDLVLQLFRRCRISYPAIANIVLGSRGIAFTAVPISDRPKESSLKIGRDSNRCLFWILTGQTRASLRNLSYFAK